MNSKEHHMRAVVYTEYGSPDVLQLQEVEKPTVEDDQVLVQVRAVSVNYPDYASVTGKPFVVRLTGSGLLRPANPILGADIAGRVEAVGANVKQFQPGDEVYGDLSGCGFGGFAEYVSGAETALAPKPSNLSFEEAAAAPMAAVVALQALRDKGQIRSGQRVLVVGASGGNGTFAVQIAKSFGAHVTGVCSTRNVDLVRSLGADDVIDYTKEDFAQKGQFYDLILATAGYRSLFDYGRALAPGGTYVSAGGAKQQTFQAMFLGPWMSITGKRRMGAMLARSNQQDLITIKELCEAGEVMPVVDRRYPLSGVAEAIRYYGQGHARGKVVITVTQDT
jgi:NADPH:quinone reductase-like Zn-dependent oxidoreductase